MSLSKLTSPDAVRAALAECDALGREEFLKKYGFRYSRLYPLRYQGRIYDSKAIAGVAYGKQHGLPLKARDFVGGEKTVIPALRRLGFELSEMTHPISYLQVGKTYFRKDLLEHFGGQMRRGIWTPREFPVVFIFSGESGEEYGYRDGWTDGDGTFRYTGEGQKGDMQFTEGNQAIRDHREENRDLLLFIDLGKGKGVRFEGVFEQASWEFVKGFDRDGNERQMIVFSLVPVSVASVDDADDGDTSLPSLSLEELRKAAYAAAAAAAAKQKPPAKSEARRTWYERSREVKRYVLARAMGICEACEKPAPFIKKNGTPYLEPHHTTRLADDGPDHPSSVGGICPTCHRRIHYGDDGKEWNTRLQIRLKTIEG